MKNIQRVVIVAVVTASMQGFIGCGGVPVNTTGGVAGAALQGNWNLVGTSLFSEPEISLAIAVNGNMIGASGTQLFGCSGGGGGGIVNMTGQIAHDGTFTMSSTGTMTLDGNAEVLTVQGTLPASGVTTWNGGYTFAFTPGSGCIQTASGSFTAMPIPPLVGTYAGSLTQGVSTSLATVGVVATLSQGSLFTSATSFNGIEYYLPLTGTLTVTGNPCFAQGAVPATSNSKIEGDDVSVFFMMNDGSIVSLDGNLNGASVATLQYVKLFPSMSSGCSGIFAGVLTKQ